MEGMRRDPRDYHHYPQHHDTPDHLREKSYHYSDSDDREVGQLFIFILDLTTVSYQPCCPSVQPLDSLILSQCNFIREFLSKSMTLTQVLLIHVRYLNLRTLGHCFIFLW